MHSIDMRIVAVVALDGVLPFDLSLPSEIFARLPPTDGEAYQVLVASEDQEVRANAFSIRAPYRLGDLIRADTVIVPGLESPDLPVSQAVLESLRAAASRGAKIASFSSGAFVLAAAGLLDGKRVTTHWKVADMFAARHPLALLDRSSPVVDSGQFMTSAGGSAGIDLCLRLIERDYGQEVAAYAARLSLVPLSEKDPDRSSFGSLGSANLGPYLEWASENLSLFVSAEQLAERAGLSYREMNRRFRAELNTSSMQWLIARRISKSKELLAETDQEVDSIARQIGFQTAKNFVERFRSATGVTPFVYRRRSRVHGRGLVIELPGD